MRPHPGRFQGLAWPTHVSREVSVSGERGSLVLSPSFSSLVCSCVSTVGSEDTPDPTTKKCRYGGVLHSNSTMSRVCACTWRRLRAVWAAQVVQRNWRGYASRRWFELLRRQQAACGHMQRVLRGALCRRRVRQMRRRRDHAAALIQVKGAGGPSRPPLTVSMSVEQLCEVLVLCFV